MPDNDVGVNKLKDILKKREKLLETIQQLNSIRLGLVEPLPQQHEGQSDQKQDEHPTEPSS